MKKLLLSVIILLSVNIVSAQFEKKIASSNKDIENPKKNTSTKTWLSRAELFQEIYNFHTKGLTIGLDRTFVAQSLKEQQSIGDEVATFDNVNYAVTVYPDKKLYFNQQGLLAFWELTIDEKDPLITAYEAYLEAIKYDKKGGQDNKKLTDDMTNLSIYMQIEASCAYSMDKFDEAYKKIKLSLEASSNPVVNTVDTAAIYNAAVIANLAKDTDAAIGYFKKAIELGFTVEGDAYLRLASVYGDKDNKVEQLKTLEEGMRNHSENTQIILGLIDYYRFSGEDPKKILPLIEKAKSADPDNPGLYYAEASLHEKIAEITKDPSDFNKAVECYKKSIEKNPNYVYGYYGLGAMYFNSGVNYNNEAIDVPVDDNERYNKLVKLVDEQFELALPLLLKAYELNPNERAIAEPLKDIYMRFRQSSPENQAGFEKFSKLLEEM